jgi:hypothetical protein
MSFHTRTRNWSLCLWKLSLFKEVSQPLYYVLFIKLQTHRTRFDNAARFFDFHWPITLILVSIFQIFGSAITIWVIWSTYLLEFALIGCFINFQKLKNRVPLSNRVRCVWMSLIWTYSQSDKNTRQLRHVNKLRKTGIKGLFLLVPGQVNS